MSENVVAVEYEDWELEVYGARLPDVKLSERIRGFMLFKLEDMQNRIKELEKSKSVDEKDEYINIAETCLLLNISISAFYRLRNKYTDFPKATKNLLNKEIMFSKQELVDWSKKLIPV